MPNLLTAGLWEKRPNPDFYNGCAATLVDSHRHPGAADADLHAYANPPGGKR
jgi:hypothetical protein